MLTCVMIAHKRFEYYHFEKLDKTNLRLVLIMPSYAQKLFNYTLKDYFDEIYVIDNVDYLSIEKIIIEELQIQNDPNLIRILCNDELFLLNIGKVRSKLFIPGPKDSDYLCFRDKIIMKEVLSKAEVRVPMFLEVSLEELRTKPELKYKELSLFFKGAFFTKPTRGASAIGAFKISSFSDFNNWINNHQLDDAYNCEEFIEGTLYLCDSFIDKGRVIFSEVCKYSYPCIEYEKGRPLGIFPLNNSDPLRSRIIDFAENVCRILKAVDGGTHLEVFVTSEQEITFLEIAARPGGAGVPKILEENYGFNTYEQSLRQILNLELNEKKPINKFYAEIFWAQKVGEVKELLEPKLKSNIDVSWFVKKGDLIPICPLGTTTPIAVKISLTASNYEDLDDDFITLKQFNPVIY